MAANAIRAFDLNSASHCPGIQTGVDGYSLNFTVAETAGPSGDIRVWPTGNPPLNVSTLVWTQTNAVVANAAIVGAGTNGSIDVQVAGSNTHLIIDINGYFTDTYNSGAPGNQLVATSTSTAADSAGMKGVDAGSGSLSGATGFARSGVRGESVGGYGVLGLSRFIGVRGDVLNIGGASLAEGRLGYAVGGTNYGVYAIGDVGATGTKSFVLPHPTDPSLVIRYVSLEGPEAGTYFRGRGHLHGRSAIIDVPESFRFVTEAESLSIQLTPIGGYAILWVTELRLDQISVQGSRDVEFFYTVNGVRRGYVDFEPIVESSEFVPGSASARLPTNLGVEARERLLSNGTYNADGSVNLTTAERLGWTRIWASSGP
jgi:hypothetical protein